MPKIDKYYRNLTWYLFDLIVMLLFTLDIKSS